MFKLIVALLLSAFSSLVFADYCFTAVKNLASCNEQALEQALNASSSNSGTISKFINNKTSIQAIAFTKNPYKFDNVQPGSPAWEHTVEMQAKWVSLQTYTVKFKVNGNKYEEQVGPNSGCYYQGTYKESKETIEFNSTNLVGNCADNEKTIAKFALGKITYRKINY
jgi:hypothetical protein